MNHPSVSDGDESPIYKKTRKELEGNFKHKLVTLASKRCTMNQIAHDVKVRKTIDMDSNLAKSIQDMADEKNWSFSYMSYVLLQQSVKERSRKRKSR